MTLPGQITGVQTVGVPVTDQDRAIDFYVGTLGFDRRLDVRPDGGRRWIEVGPDGSAPTIALFAAHEGGPARWKPASGSPLEGLLRPGCAARTARAN